MKSATTQKTVIAIASAKDATTALAKRRPSKTSPISFAVRKSHTCQPSMNDNCTSNTGPPFPRFDNSSFFRKTVMTNKSIPQSSSVIEFVEAAQALAVAAEILMRDVNVAYRRRVKFRNCIMEACRLYHEVKTVERPADARTVKLVSDQAYFRQLGFYPDEPFQS
jgi:hypothetical protein